MSPTARCLQQVIVILACCCFIKLAVKAYGQAPDKKCREHPEEYQIWNQDNNQYDCLVCIAARLINDILTKAINELDQSEKDDHFNEGLASVIRQPTDGNPSHYTFGLSTLCLSSQPDPMYSGLYLIRAAARCPLMAMTVMTRIKIQPSKT